MIKNSTIQFAGNGILKVQKGARLINVSLLIDENSSILIGERTTIHGPDGIAALEGGSITIGNDCMFSSSIEIRTGDSHSIINADGVRINHSKNIKIGNHVWIGQRVFLLKGTHIPDHCVVGACSLVNKSFNEDHCLIAGNPAKVCKTRIDWIRELI